MKSLTTAAALCLALAVTPLLSPRADAQTRTRRSPASSAQRRRGATANAGAKPDQTQINSARIKLADRIKTLSQFLYLYGRLSKDLELTGTQTGSNDAVAKSRAALVSNIGNVRQGLDDLVAQFRFTPGLEQQSAALSSAAQRAADAESQATAGRFNDAGLTLVEVVRQLTDVLIEM
ncbi:MAG: hypothetical protein M3268_03005 [Acidobacteriota bacterium]|nr:hypothetical protein [Acidobacteriota bacterium]